MNHDNIGTTIRELHEKVRSITFEMTKNAGRHVDKSVPLEHMPANRELRLELADFYNELGHAYQQIGNEGHANFYFMNYRFFREGGEE